MKFNIKLIFCLVLISGSVLSMFSQIETGKGSFNFDEFPSLKDKKMLVHYYLPKGEVKNMPILFVMHGVLRNADVYRDNWIELANEFRFVVIVPEFSKENFPGSRSYNYGNLFEKNGEPIDEEYWSYSLIDPIFDAVVLKLGSNALQYDLFGHSAGSQFAHRFFLFKTETKARRVIAANAGSYTMLNDEVNFPFGLKNTNLSEKGIKKLLSNNLIIQLGEADTDPNHKYLNRSKEALEQGSNRFLRGLNFYEHAEKLSQYHDIEFKWQLRTVPMVGHDNGKMAIDAARFLYQDIKPLKE